VKAHRLASTREATRKLADYPTLFGEIRQPEHEYILIPCHSSEKREYIPFGFLKPAVIVGNANLCIPNADLYIFGVISSRMHMAWVRSVCGRLESRYRYTNQIVYNNFPWPRAPSETQQRAVEQAAQAVLGARAKFPGASLADLYDPLAMPPELRRAHQDLDRAVDAAYGRKKFSADAERVAFLFDLYRQTTSLLPAAPAAKRRGKAPRHGD